MARASIYHAFNKDGRIFLKIKPFIPNTQTTGDAFVFVKTPFFFERQSVYSLDAETKQKLKLFAARMVYGNKFEKHQVDTDGWNIFHTNMFIDF